MIIEISEENYEQEVAQSNLPVIIDFYAIWCGPCKITKPIFMELAQEYSGKMKFAFLNIDQHRNLAIKFGITSIPTFVITKQGQEVGKVIGSRSHDDLKLFIESQL